MVDYLKAFSLEGKVSLVTGGGRGLGLGIATALAGAGSDLVLVARTKEQLDNAARVITAEYGRRVEKIQGDVSRLEKHSEIVEQALDFFGRIDVLVNNAGTNVRKPFLDVTPDEFDQVITTNLKSVFFLSQYVVKKMIETGGGKIINLASLSSVIGIKNIAVYASSKGGVFALTKALAVELAPHKINVNAIGPGYVRTAMTEAAFQDRGRYEWMLSRTPLGRSGRPEDIGNAALYLASQASDYLTGEVIFVDGGWMSA